MLKKEFRAEREERLSSLLTREFLLRYGDVASLLKKKDVSVNGERVKADVRVKAGDRIVCYLKESPKADTPSLFWKVLYEDEEILVLLKPKGVSSDAVFKTLLKEREARGENLFYVHRLDLNTDGVTVFGKTETAYEELSDGFQNHRFLKNYVATVYGKPDKPHAVLKDYLIKDGNSAKVRIVKSPENGAKAVITEYDVLSTETVCGLPVSRLFITLHTGRTHQIRAHFAYYGHFVLGDGKYGNGEINRKLGIKKQLLSAVRLTLLFPETSPLYYLNEKTFTHPDFGGKIN